MNSKSYETLYILKAGLAEENYKELVDKFNGWITSNEGEIVESKVIGNRELPTTFRKHRQGYFVLCQFKGTRKTIEALDEQILVTETVIRYLTVLTDSIYDSRPKKAPKIKATAVTE